MQAFPLSYLRKLVLDVQQSHLAFFLVCFLAAEHLLELGLAVLDSPSDWTFEMDLNLVGVLTLDQSVRLLILSFGDVVSDFLEGHDFEWGLLDQIDFAHL